MDTPPNGNPRRVDDVYRPSDRDLLKRAIRETAARTGNGVFFAGLVNRTDLTITEFFGTMTHGLKNLSVQPGEGIGGRALAQARPIGVADYLDSDRITHHHDEAVRIEGLRAMVAVPILVGGQTRCILYVATRERTSIGEWVVNELSADGSKISRELAFRDEVDHRVSILRVADSVAAEPPDRDLVEAVRLAHAELLSVARITDDPELARRILAVTAQLEGSGAAPAGSPRFTRRETDVLAQVALGCSYAETGKRLSLKAVTVKSYMQSIMAKLNVHSRMEAVVVARRLRLLP
ncbi:LuxR C-terminal-related transcriptional regulator [Pseudarthrobacter sp. HLT3-5]|uniref:helix-turn-helix transcriptional regulator n=1 Tax=Pseudarthrobacter cellobiosi TaxID=2953654 RepID=UPI00208E596F|nr:LuxR C-terminal-related transcriptional regulator [Pseudarthrobacter sp. HLT3-5]MCO4275975.1 LuxR C-terminal-related transcriptional regulator [Pseudarthrobacter sp. HLT3-5]